MKILTLLVVAAAACGGSGRTAARGAGTADRGGEAIGVVGPGACHERYDDELADRASPAATATLVKLIAAAQQGARRTLAIAVDRGLDAGGDDRAPPAEAVERAAALEALLVRLPATCTPIW